MLVDGPACAGRQRQSLMRAERTDERERARERERERELQPKKKD
jgi:hypothetical protein